MGQESKFCLDLNPFHMVSLRIGEFVAFKLAKRSLILRQVFLLLEKQNQTSLLAEVSDGEAKIFTSS